MKLGRTFKPLLLATTAALYATGVAVWALDKAFRVETEYGPEPSAWKSPALHAHSAIGLLFLILFGYLWSVHIEPGLKQKKKRASGWTLLSVFGVLFATVPLIFYATGDATRAAAAAVHTWLGAALIVPFLVHLRAKARGRRESA